MSNIEFKVPFSGVGAKYTENEKAAVLKAMELESTLTQGVYQQEFEEKFSNYVNKKHAFATNCAATALELAAILIELKPGDEVICPAHTYCASAYPFAKHGAKLVWADINPRTLVIDKETIEPLITDRTVAIIAVHLYGLPAPMKQICQLGKEHNIVIIEDCAQAIGASINDQVVGSFADISIFSFQSHKNISTLGEGGMICFDDDDWASILPGLRHNGHKPFPSDREFYWKPAMNNVDFDIEGVWPNNFCIGEVQCALGIETMDRVGQLNDARKKRFDYFTNEFSSSNEMRFQLIPEGYKSSYHLLPFKYKHNKTHSDDFIKMLAFEYGVQAIVQYYPLNRYPLFIQSDFGEADIPNTDEFFDNMVSLPFHVWMSDDDFEYMTDSVKKSLVKLLG